MYQILLIEDCKDIFHMVTQATTTIANLDWAKSIEDANKFLAKSEYDLIVMDIGLPDGNGISFCSQLQDKFSQTPIFILTGDDDLAQKVLGFSAGADDYITKPFLFLELRARIAARLQKNKKFLMNSDTIKWKELSISHSRQEVTITAGEQSRITPLTSLEFKILLYFAYRPDIVLTRDQILNDIWGESTYVNHRTVDTHVSKLRKRLDKASPVIRSVHGSGYKFAPTRI